jgi:hypothetical protein
MHKVVVERPRGGQGWARQFPRPKAGFDDLPARQGIRRPHSQRKWFTDVLGPLRRWMHSQVGRPWNAVYSEACAVIKPDSVVRAHIKTHLLEFVQRHTFMQDGRVWCFTHGWQAGGRPIEQAASRWTPFYVHPITGRLCEVPPRPRRRPHEELRDRRAVTQRWLTKTLLLRRIHGLWFACEMRPFPPEHERGNRPDRFDLAERKQLSGAEASKIYGQEVYCIAKLQLSRKELKLCSLANAPALTRSASASGRCPVR